MSTDFLGRGWQFPPRPGDGAAIALSAGEEDIRQSIALIIGTQKGERVMRPEFGCALHHMVFETMTTATFTRIGIIVHDALLHFEPRIEVTDVAALPNPDEEGRIDINIRYRTRTTNNVFNMVYPFYLNAGETP